MSVLYSLQLTLSHLLSIAQYSYMPSTLNSSGCILHEFIKLNYITPFLNGLLSIKIAGYACGGQQKRAI